MQYFESGKITRMRAGNSFHDDNPQALCTGGYAQSYHAKLVKQ
jgi:hypothetical protein